MKITIEGRNEQSFVIEDVTEYVVFAQTKTGHSKFNSQIGDRARCYLEKILSVQNEQELRKACDKEEV